ncbi:MAG: hypothetical protein WCZ27_02620 [Tissierellaceae bacterium]
MYLDERLKKIDEFFKDLEIGEFEEMLIRAGIGEIDSSNNSDMELLLSMSLNSKISEYRYSKSSSEQVIINGDYHNLYYDDYARAV